MIFLSFGVIVGIIVRRHGKPVSPEVLCMALAGLFEGVFAHLDDDELGDVMVGAVVLAGALGLVEATPSGSFRATETRMDPSLMPYLVRSVS